MSQSFWQGRRVFLTGHTGFKGGWLSLWLQSLGAEVTGYALEPLTNKPSLYELTNLALNMRSLIGDIRDFDLLKKTIKNNKPEIVFHLAAQPLVRYSYINPIETYQTNIMGTAHLFEAVRKVDTVRVVVNVTSDKCYENRELSKGFCENEPMGGYDPYSSSKGCAELVTAAYRSSFFNTENYSHHGVAVASARAGNVIGGGDWADDRLVPDFFRAVFMGKSVIVRNPYSIRPWQYVLEPLNGYLKLAESLFKKGAKFAEAWNFGPPDNDEKTVEWIMNNLVKNWGSGAKYTIEDCSEKLHEAKFLKLDSTKAREKLNWKPIWSVDKAIEKICWWYKAYLRGENMQKYSLQEIFQYQKDLLD